MDSDLTSLDPQPESEFDPGTASNQREDLRQRQAMIAGLIVGVVVGTYSSLFIASPIMYDTINKLDKKN